MAAPQGGIFGSQAWYNPSGEAGLAVTALKDLISSTKVIETNSQEPFIAHYLLLPTYDGEISDAQFEIIRPFIKAHKPTIGFSIQEAKMAQRVTVLDGPGTYPKGVISKLRTDGCIVNEIEGHGIEIASFIPTEKIELPSKGQPNGQSRNPNTHPKRGNSCSQTLPRT